VKSFWQTLDRSAAAVTILTTLGAVVIWFLAREKLIGPAHAQAYTTATIAGISVVGVGCVVGGFIMRQNGYAVFTPNRGRTGITTLLLGAGLLAVAIVGLVTL
jgi:hypothetical protein